ncbi:hypothetical protein F3G58_33155, partial [Pseudomonas aeruginosa]
MLATALIHVCVTPRIKHIVRCIVDSGSQATFITEACAQRLNLARKYTNVPVFGVGDSKPVYPNGVVTFCVTPRNGDQPSIPVEAFIFPKIVLQNMPSVSLPFKEWPHIQNITLADPNF